MNDDMIFFLYFTIIALVGHSMGNFLPPAFYIIGVGGNVGQVFFIGRMTTR